MRRGHGSTKVPNVKLRPVTTGSSKTAKNASKELSDTYNDLEDHGNITDELGKPSRLPFNKVVVCLSGVSDKSTLFSKAKMLGAVGITNLTDKVTHLIADGPGSQKYIYCAKHGIPIMKSSWITDTFDQWLNGEEVDFHENLRKHRLPTLVSVRLCVTGIEPVERRMQIHKVVTDNGGVYLRDLDRNSTVTHLVCGEDDVDDTPRKGRVSKRDFTEKLNQKNDTKVHIVWEEWLWDSLKFGGQLETNDYLITTPRPQPKSRSQVSTSSPMPRSSLPYSDIKAVTASEGIFDVDDTEETVAKKHAPEVAARIWSGLLKRRGFEVKDGKLARGLTKASDDAVAGFNGDIADWPPAETILPIETHSKSLLSSLHRLKSFTESGSSKENSNGLRVVESHEESETRLLSRTASDISYSTAPQSIMSSFGPPNPGGKATLENLKFVFTNKTFYLFGEANSSTVIKAIETSGGLLVDVPSQETDFLLVRLSSGGSYFRQETDGNMRRKFRTECWLEKCLYDERICAASEHVTFAPLHINIPISDASSLVLHFSGLEQSEKCWALRLTRALGLSVTEKTFSRRNTHLICPSRVGSKYDKALEWQIPVVTMDWLSSIAQSGKISSIPRPAPLEAEEVEESRITDITNSDHSQRSSGQHCRTSGAILPKDVQSKSLIEPQQKSVSLIASSSNTAQGKASSSDPSTQEQVNPRQMLTPAESTPVESPFAKNEKLTRIPSSESPSPLKLPQTRHNSTITGESVLALKDTIVSLLGKRPAVDNEETPKEHSSSTGKRSKRPLRPKSKFLSSKSSEGILQSSLSRPPSPSPSQLQYTAEGLRAIQSETLAVDESMHVSYEDPGQRTEKEKLLMLIEGGQSISAKPPDQDGGAKRSRGSRLGKDVKQSRNL